MNFSSDDFLFRIKNREHEAVSELVSAYHEVLIKAAIKQGLSFDQADEVSQAVWSTFFEKIENFEGRSHIRTYLFGILYNKIKEIWRSNKKYTEEFDDKTLEHLFNQRGSYAQAPQDPQDWLENKDLGIIILELIEKLPEAQKMAFILKEIEGESTEDICKILDISVTNLGVLIYRAKNKLRLALEKRMDEVN